MGASITLAGENLIAQKQAASAGLKVASFVFANVPGLNASTPVDRAAAKPPAAQVVYTYPIPSGNAGYVNPNQVVYSSQLGSDVGDWDFNWVGLESEEGVLFAVSYVPLQQKRRNIPPLQIGNNVTRNFMVVFDGAQAMTGITIDASTWQHDFTVRLAGIDERERLSNRDVFGRACFFGTGLQLESVAGTLQLKAGTAYVEGIRLQQSAVLPVVATKFPTTAWLDVALERGLNDVAATMKVVFAADLVDYSDPNGVRHYCVPLADLPDANTVTDRRRVEEINDPLVTHFAARSGDYLNLRARATTKEDVDLGNLPNAKSDDPLSVDSEVLATTKMVSNVRAQLDTDISAKLPLSGGSMAGTIGFDVKALGGSLAAWRSRQAALDLSCPSNDLAYLLWKAAKKDERYLAGMEVSAGGTSASPPQVVTHVGTTNSAMRLAEGGHLSIAGTYSGNAAGLTNLPEATPTVRGAVRKNTASFGESGWWMCAETGLIKQWGVTLGASDKVNHRSFPIAFPNRCLCLVATRTSFFYDDPSTGTNALIVSNSQFSVISGPFSSPDTIYWEATGY